MKARLTLAIAFCALLAACAGPSLRYKKEVNARLAAGDFAGAAAKIEKNKTGEYGERDELLYLLDLATAQNAAHDNAASNATLALAQQKTDDLYARSAAGALGTLLVNDYTEAYRPPLYERAFTHFMRALDFLAQQDLSAAAVEARRAVFMLDNARQAKDKGYNDDAFTQYFASMIFEDLGQRSDARIARANAAAAYERQKSESRATFPQLNPPPPNAAEMGEAVILHLNGVAPYKISKSLMFAWDDIWFTLQSSSDMQGVQQDTINAILAGAFGKSISVSFPALEQERYHISGSTIAINGLETAQTQLVGDVAAAAQETLAEQNLANKARTLTRAATKYILSVQARHAAQQSMGDTAGALAGIFTSVLSAATEQADTRSWFTLPGEVRMASVFLPPGKHDIKLIFYDDKKHVVDEHLFKEVQINKGRRTYLYHRTAR